MKYIILCIILFLNASAFAGVLANKSRVIFDSSGDEQTLLIANTNDYPVIVQTWVDNGNGNPLSVVPLVVTPSTFRLEPKEMHALKIINISDKTTASSSELIYWLNLYEIPPKDTNINDINKSRVDLTMNTQHKIFIRPPHLDSFPSDIEKYITFTLIEKNKDNFLLVKNTSSYHISFTGMNVASKNDSKNSVSVEQEMDMTLKPNSERLYSLQKKFPINSNVVTFSYINDAGSVINQSTSLRK